MTRSHVSVFATALAVAGLVAENAAASTSRHAATAHSSVAAAARTRQATHGPRSLAHRFLRGGQAGVGRQSGQGGSVSGFAGGASLAATGTIGSTLPSPNAALSIRALGSEDGGFGDDGAGSGGGVVAHGSIGSAPPSANAAGSLRSLGGDDGGEAGDDGGAGGRGVSAHGSIGSAPPSANAANAIRSLGGGDD